MTDIERLVALEEIRTLHARRDRYLDTHDWDALQALHAPDHRTHAVGTPPSDRAGDAVANVRALAERMRFVHQSHSPDISFESASKARAVWRMSTIAEWNQTDAEHWLVGFGHYYETYEKRDGRWLITSREEKLFLTKQSPGARVPIDDDAVQLDEQ
jgi:hypothetical protein